MGERLSEDHLRAALAALDGWSLCDEGRAISKRWTFKGYAKAVEMANLAAWHGNRMDHHPDVAFGWGWCEVRYTTHDADGLTARDFDCAARLDALLA